MRARKRRESCEGASVGFTAHRKGRRGSGVTEAGSGGGGGGRGVGGAPALPVSGAREAPGAEGNGGEEVGRGMGGAGLGGVWSQNESGALKRGGGLG